MRRSLPSMPMGRPTRMVLALAFAAAVGVTAAGTANAQSNKTVYNCTGTAPEICVGVTYNSSTIVSAQVQVKVSSPSYDVMYDIQGPSGTGWNSGELGSYSAKSGWVTSASVPVGHDFTGQYCGSATGVNGGQDVRACVTAS